MICPEKTYYVKSVPYSNGTYETAPRIDNVVCPTCKRSMIPILNASKTIIGWDVFLPKHNRKMKRN